ncbi:MaoC/PaaZ C-terminal domain-containing protein [Glycomyces paridis]|uniref:Acyl dehydratase n=1 Tax=Glycomyces paridis TaxID=2126555 RepID=A0A4S8PBI1_9ACTN|nr:MaoC/PaaZ C-terminal domain-containing protein [Glycomyces paridis]THV27653.1 acyl dehydratase [Glycomyces paridis]
MSLADLTAGETAFTTPFTVVRSDLVAYADASGDHNPIHLDEAAAEAAGLPDVIAHGMYTMGLVSRAVLEWAASTGETLRLTEFSARFARPVVVPADGGADLVVEAKVRRADADSVELTVTVTSGGERVLAPARATLTAN